MTRTPTRPRTRPRTLAVRLLGAHDAGRRLSPISAADPDLTIADGYDIAAEVHALRRARGETPAGRKIGFTNRNIWPIYNVDAPLWGWVYDSTLSDLPPDGGPVHLPRLPELRIEPEIALRLGRAPRPGMDDAELAACIDGVAHGFELVFSVYPGWKFTAADCAAAFGMHAALLLGPMQPAEPLLADGGRALADLTITLAGPGTTLHGRGSDVLGGPLQALRFLCDALAARPEAPPLGRGEIVTTGTLTDAAPVRPGETWQTRIDGAGLPGARVTFAPA